MYSHSEDFLSRAANSNLTPMADEFIPRGYYNNQGYNNSRRDFNQLRSRQYDNRLHNHNENQQGFYSNNAFTDNHHSQYNRRDYYEPSGSSGSGSSFSYSQQNSFNRKEPSRWQKYRSESFEDDYNDSQSYFGRDQRKSRSAQSNYVQNNSSENGTNIKSGHSNYTLNSVDDNNGNGYNRNFGNNRDWKQRYKVSNSHENNEDDQDFKDRLEETKGNRFSSSTTNNDRASTSYRTFGNNRDVRKQNRNIPIHNNEQNRDYIQEYNDLRDGFRNANRSSNSNNFEIYSRPHSSRNAQNSYPSAGSHIRQSKGDTKTKSRTANSVPPSKDKTSGQPAGEDSVGQRDRLIEQLNEGLLECLVCCDRIKQREPVWSCNNCYHVLHMWCIIKWAKSSDKETWRCPACQHESVDVPNVYECFCGKRRLLTEWNRSDTAHSCGEMCGRVKNNSEPWFTCSHPCTLLCHPGPCPPCTVLVNRECGCGRSRKTVQCNTKVSLLCGMICDRMLNCAVHHCTKTCHFGECDPCDAKVEIECYCGKDKRIVPCGSEESLIQFSCNEQCGRLLSCGQHKCEEICHEGECGLCPRMPVVVDTCCCGKMPAPEGSRNSCLDPLPTCGQVCGKTMPCGPKNKHHTCELLCHEGECGPCSKVTSIKCRCGSKDQSVKCIELKAKVGGFICQKKCSKKRSCGKHKCNQTCCIDTDHVCPVRCSGQLRCGKHKCDMLCHLGKCGPCLQSSFDELYCHCGNSVIYPPVPCGTKPPECNQPCQREHDCDHPPSHACHSEASCPPCTFFTDKLCYGKHELRKTIPCHQKEFSCGLPCGNPLPCSVHKCTTPCHAGDCLKPGTKCTQPCVKPRTLCGHPCKAPCHSGPCPNTLCREPIKVTCTCGNISEMHPCHEHAEDYERIGAASLATKVSEMNLANFVDPNLVTVSVDAKNINLRILECNDECAIIMRRKHLAMCFQIQNPDLSAKLAPKYSDFMKNWAKRDPNLCAHIHEKLTALVKLAKESKQKSRSFSFEVMNKEKRQLVHEYCVHFGCESEAYDAEPKRNVVATAVKNKCWLPSYSLLQVVQRDMGQRRVPIPGFNKKPPKNSAGNVSSYSNIILPVLPAAASSSRYDFGN